MHAGGEDVEAELVREPRLGAKVREARVHVLAAAELTADEEAVLHGAPQPATGSCESVRRQSSSSGSIADQSRVQWCSARSNLVGGLSVAATLR